MLGNDFANSFGIVFPEFARSIRAATIRRCATADVEFSANHRRKECESEIKRFPFVHSALPRLGTSSAVRSLALTRRLGRACSESQRAVLLCKMSIQRQLLVAFFALLACVTAPAAVLLELRVANTVQ